MKKIWILAIGILLIGTNLYAADLIVDGSIGIRTTNPSYNIDIVNNAQTSSMGAVNISNSSTGSDAQTAFRLVNNLGSIAAFSLLSSGWATHGAFVPDGAYVDNTGSAGLSFVAYSDSVNADIRFATGIDATTKLIIKNTGNVAINTMDLADAVVPSENDKFKIVDGPMSFGFKDYASGQGFISVSNGTIRGYAQTNDTDGFVIGTQTNHKLGLRVNNTNYLTINTTGYIGLGITNPSYPLQLANGAYVTSGGVWTNASSRDYKENIKELNVETAIEALGKLNPVTYNYKVDANEKHVGFIAEDAPDLVASKDRKGLSPMDIVAVLTRVVQEQQKKIDQLSSEIQKMKGTF